jgi:hypothetical protein
LAGAAKKLTPTLEKAGEAIRRLASKLKPQVDYDLADQSLRDRERRSRPVNAVPCAI